MSTSLQSARATLTGPLKFGDAEQVQAVRTIERSGPRSDGQRKRWVEAERSFCKALELALNRQILQCPHCGRLPWSALPVCGRHLVLAYKLNSHGARGGAGKWLIQNSKRWYRNSGAKVLRMVEDTEQ